MPESHYSIPSRIPIRHIPELQDRLATPIPKERLDELLLELILIDTVALADPDRGPVAERLIERVLSPNDYMRVLDRYDQLSDDSDDESKLMSICFTRAASKDSRWKSKMLKWFTHIVGAGRPLSQDGLVEVASFASAMGATLECQALYSTLFGIDPYA
jgi:hypothetical protein